MAERTVLDGADGARAAVGTHLGYSDWLEITQERVDQFADATGDHQWIHVDVERAKSTPFGGTIAHGYLTLSLTPMFAGQIVRFQGWSMVVNYGVDRVRFPAPLLVGSRARGGVELVEVTDVPGGWQTKLVITVEVEGQEKPCCVVESLARWYV
jgi:acyl dehydratase